MDNFQLYFIAENSEFEFDLKIDSDESKIFLEDFLLCFKCIVSENGKKQLTILQYITQEMLDDLEKLFSIHSSNNPKFIGFLKCFKIIGIDNYFYMLKNKLNQEKSIEAKIELKVLNEKKYNSKEELEILLNKEKESFFSFASPIIDNYEVKVFSATTKKYILASLIKNYENADFAERHLNQV